MDPAPLAKAVGATPKRHENVLLSAHKQLKIHEGENGHILLHSEISKVTISDLPSENLM
jgi:hypothetical protein